jgi:hypothetical protein
MGKCVYMILLRLCGYILYAMKQQILSSSSIKTQHFISLWGIHSAIHLWAGEDAFCLFSIFTSDDDHLRVPFLSPLVSVKITGECRCSFCGKKEIVNLVLRTFHGRFSFLIQRSSSNKHKTLILLQRTPTVHETAQKALLANAISSK